MAELIVANADFDTSELPSTVLLLDAEAEPTGTTEACGSGDADDDPDGRKGDERRRRANGNDSGMRGPDRRRGPGRR